MENVFDREESERRKEEGMRRAAEARRDNLVTARAIAIRIAVERGDQCCWADLVQQELDKVGIDLGPAAGSLFRGKNWEFTGQFVKSARAANHSRLQQVWRLV